MQPFRRLNSGREIEIGREIMRLNMIHMIKNNKTEFRCGRVGLSTILGIQFRFFQTPLRTTLLSLSINEFALYFCCILCIIQTL